MPPCKISSKAEYRYQHSTGQGSTVDVERSTDLERHPDSATTQRLNVIIMLAKSEICNVKYQQSTEQKHSTVSINILLIDKIMHDKILTHNKLKNRKQMINNLLRGAYSRLRFHQIK